MSNFKLGQKSIAELKGVHPDLVAIVKRAIELTVQDFAVHDGIRTVDEQKKMVESGASQTLNSRHITGHAVDLVPYVNNKLRWEWEPIYKIADAVRMAAKELGTPIVWGGNWNVLFSDTFEPPADVVARYVAVRKKAGLNAFIDGPHFELPRSVYP
jgi:peptidoglycan L-alanyl-D-glutamate endopeptidase CwlK